MRLARQFGLLFLLVCLAAIAAGAKDKIPTRSEPKLLEGITEIKSDAQLSEWTDYYYLHPRPDLVPSALGYLSKKSLLKHVESAVPMTFFLAQVFRANPALVPGWADLLMTRSEDQQHVFASALWLVGTPESRKLLSEISGKGAPGVREHAVALLAEKQIFDLLATDFDPTTLDCLWASFFATGDERYVKRIITALPLEKVRELSSTLVGASAHWSLAANARQHPRVLEICEGALISTPDDQWDALDQREALTDIIAKAGKKK